MKRYNSNSAMHLSGSKHGGLAIGVGFGGSTVGTGQKTTGVSYLLM